ncbi:MAG TPA: DUF3987 domain-containing protein, partial [Dehalococcoidia bacterium]|nr:DUF3987 domain-containing protein [Dehalococcoidia bacterium]
IDLPIGHPDTFATFLLYSADLDDHVQQTGSVAGFSGPARSLVVPFDFDCKADPAHALDDARRLLHLLGERWDVPLEAVRLYFSGSKGFHAELPAALFGGFAPCVEMPALLKALAHALTVDVGITTLDPAIYSRLRLWRWPNSIHGASGLYRIPLTPAELLDNDLDTIREWATQPRQALFPDLNDWLPVPGLVALYHDARAQVQARTNKRANEQTADNGADDAIPEGRRNATLWSMAGAMRRKGFDEPAILAALRSTNARRCAPPLPDADVADIAHRICAYEPVPDDAQAGNRTARGESLAAVLPFPTEALPEAARAYVDESAAAIGCPPEYIALPLLTFAGGAMGRRYRIVLKPDYVQLPTLFTVCVGPPGSMKSPALQAARWPLDVLQREAHEQYKAELREFEQASVAWQAAARKGEAVGPRPEPPVERHFYSTDATKEALAFMLDGAAGLTLCRDEIVAWVAGFDAYRNGRGGDRQDWLSMWSGAALKVDRKGKPSIFIPEPVVCVTGGTQPDSLPLLAAEAERLDGFIERLLWAWPDTVPASWSERSVSEGTKELLLRSFRDLDANGGDVDLSPEARAVWAEWYNAIHERAAAASGLMAGILAKLPNQIARIALILHVLVDPASSARTPVMEPTMRDALRLASYFISHAGRVLPALVRRTAPTLAARVLRCLEEAPGWLNKRSLFKALGNNVSAANLDLALAELEEQGCVERRETAPGGNGGRPGVEWRCVRADGDAA